MSCVALSSITIIALMQDTFDPVAWKALIATRRGKTFNDYTAMGVMKYISIHVFQTANGPEWPNQFLPEIFGVCKVSGHKYRVCRNLHGFNVIFASGRFLPAHAARLSDMVEHLFGKYRLEPARAKLNFSAGQAAADVANEKSLTAALLDFEKILIEKGVIPPADKMEAVRAIGAPRHKVVRTTALAAMQRQLDSQNEILSKKIRELIEAASIKIEEIESRLNELEKIGCATPSNSATLIT